MISRSRGTQLHMMQVFRIIHANHCWGSNITAIKAVIQKDCMHKIHFQPRFKREGLHKTAKCRLKNMICMSFLCWYGP